MGLSQEDIRNATIIPAGCLLVIGLMILTCCCLRSKNRTEEIERRRGLEKKSNTRNIKMDDVKANSTNSYTNGGGNFRTFNDIPFDGRSTDTQTPCSNASYEDDGAPETIYDGPGDQLALKENGSTKDKLRKTREMDSDNGSSSSASIRDAAKVTTQIPVSM